MITETSLELIRLHGHYKAGHLLVDGGILSQPHYYLAAMELIENT